MRSGLLLAALIALLPAFTAPAADASVIAWDGSAIPPGSTYFRPFGIVIGPDGHLYVSDTDRAGTAGPLHPRVVEFDRDGVYQSQWETGGHTPGRLTADSAGNLYVADALLEDSVRKYSRTGVVGSPSEFTCSPPPQPACIGNPTGVGIGAAGSLYVASQAGSKVFRFDGATGASLGHWATPSQPASLAVAPDGHVYIAEPDNSRVSRYEADGAPAGTIASPGAYEVAVGPDGDVYVGSSDGVRKYDPTGTFLGIWNVSRVASVAVDGLGRVFVTRPAGNTSQGSGGDVQRLDPSTEAPIPALTATPAPAWASELVTLDASASTPPALGVISRYEWDLDGDGTYETDTGTTPTVGHRFIQSGEQTVRVRMTGTVGSPATKTITLTVRDPLTVMASVPGLVLTGDPVAFSAGPGAAEESAIERFEWDLDGDGSFETDTGTMSSVQHSYDKVQAITTAVRVTRTGGRVDTATRPVEVRLKPPPGELGVSINAGAFATNDPHVTLSLVWPQYADRTLLSNDGGFGAAGSTDSFLVAPEVEWTLPSGGAQLPKTVYARFKADGSSISETLTDDIVLDEDAPMVTSAAVRRHLLRVKARDDNTGIRTIVVKRVHAARASKTLQLAPANRQAKPRVSVRLHLPREMRRPYVRAIDVAGNKSRWRRVRLG